MANFYPTVDELSESDLEKLRGITPDNLEIDIRYQFTDDQAQCLDVEINGVKLALQWISAYSAAAFYFTHDSPSARAEVVSVIREQVEDYLEDKG